jgi:hypothetical protein
MMIYSAETRGQKSRSVVMNRARVLFATAYCIAYVLSQTQSKSEIRFKIQCITRTGWELY